MMRRTILVVVLLVLGGSVAGVGPASAVTPGPAEAIRCDGYSYWGIAGNPGPGPYMYADVNNVYYHGVNACGTPEFGYIVISGYTGPIDDPEVTFTEGPRRVYTLTATGTVTLNDGSVVDVLETWTSEARPTVIHNADRTRPGCIVFNTTSWAFKTGTGTLTIDGEEYASFSDRDEDGFMFGWSIASLVCRS